MDYCFLGPAAHSPSLTATWGPIIWEPTVLDPPVLDPFTRSPALRDYYTLAAKDPKQRKGLRPEELLLAFFAWFALLVFLAFLALLVLLAYLCSAIYVGKLGAYSLEAYTLGAYSLGGYSSCTTDFGSNIQWTVILTVQSLCLN